MARMATRIASGLAAAGIATILSTTPAQAVVLPDPPACDSPAASSQLPRRRQHLG